MVLTKIACEYWNKQHPTFTMSREPHSDATWPHILAPSTCSIAPPVVYVRAEFCNLNFQEIPSWHLPLCYAVLFSKLLLKYCVEIRVLSQFSIIFRARISDMTKQNNFYVSLLPLSHLNWFLMYLLKEPPSGLINWSRIVASRQIGLNEIPLPTKHHLSRYKANLQKWIRWYFNQKR